MICDHPLCNGNHRTSTPRKADMCPAAYERRRTRIKARYDTDPEFRQRKRAAMKKLRDSSPTYRERSDARSREWRSNLPADRYAQEMLKNRRRLALRRMAQRNAEDSTETLGRLLIEGGQ